MNREREPTDAAGGAGAATRRVANSPPLLERAPPKAGAQTRAPRDSVGDDHPVDSGRGWAVAADAALARGPGARRRASHRRHAEPSRQLDGGAADQARPRDRPHVHPPPRRGHARCDRDDPGSRGTGLGAGGPGARVSHAPRGLSRPVQPDGAIRRLAAERQVPGACERHQLRWRSRSPCGSSRLRRTARAPSSSRSI